MSKAKIKKYKPKSVKVGLKKENAILKDLCAYLFGSVSSSGQIWEHYSNEIKRLKAKIKKLEGKNGRSISQKTR